MQQLLIIPNPEAAYEQCIEYMPNCDTPFPYAEHPTDRDDHHNVNGNEDDFITSRHVDAPAGIDEVIIRNCKTRFLQCNFIRGILVL